MNSKKLYSILVGVLILLGIGVIVSAREANTLLESKSNTLVSLKAKSQAVDNQRVQLVQDKQDIAKYAELNQIAQSVVPQDKNQAEAVRQIVDLASQSGIGQLTSITFPASTLGGTSGSIQSSNKLTQVTPVKGIPGVYNLAITITQDSSSPVPYSSFITFLGKLEQNRRTAVVNSISIEPDQKNPGQVAFTLVVSEFIKP